MEDIKNVFKELPLEVVPNMVSKLIFKKCNAYDS